MKSIEWSGRTCGLHGVRTAGENNVDDLEQPMIALGHVFVDVQIPRRLAMTARFNLLEDLEQILDESREGDAMIGHSNGGYLGAWATRFRRYSTLILVNAALPRTFDVSRSKGCEIFNIYSAGDTVLRLARVMPWPRWGTAGLVGLDALDDAHNVRTSGGHSEIFAAENEQVWALTFDRWIRKGRPSG